MENNNQCNADELEREWLEIKNSADRDNISRYWVMFTASGANPKALHALACKLLDTINHKEFTAKDAHGEEATFKGFTTDPEKDPMLQDFAIRADVVEDPGGSPFILASLSAHSDEQIQAMVEKIAGEVAVQEVQRWKVARHYPIRTWQGQGFVTKQEANFPAGRVKQEGHNHWG